ncbi:molybdenum ABC transporter ATP-binding protein [endosymbiont of Ridgeia piscesae]|jgi:molybdate transport system ATP-binding protein|uniref:Molybdate transport system ATP-binding protein n=1 Tax=endosymbiont of Ridgeia piscesae TaxID=54398 RepID=A0A0T5YY49_9GAMM|nr:molybdenum ABC transporter ATP-binding protein [endosymbiont of Ridgeia piscesae]KRT55045.1 molybdenum ABC transporter, ATP-binding protein [endosymbiont of Ridgeia piscesae]KRT57074.1 molybdate transport system ATP-binding protein [endosymbiont of Ridgeia piscesae]
MSIQARFQIERGEFQLSTEFTLPASGVSAIFGPSGCGKTTLLRAIAGLEQCHDGYLKIGDSLWQDGRHFVPTHHRRLGYVFQEASLFPHLRVRGNLEYGLKRLSAGERRVDFDQAVALLGLEPLLARRPNGLSGGERQRVAIARALLTSPQLLLMDEPLAALDLQSKAEILPFLERLHAELAIPILYVSHAPEEVARLADHILLMEAGKIRASGPIAEIFTRSDLPLAHGSDAEAIIEGRVVSHDDRFHLTSVAFSGGRFTLARSEIKVGQAVRLRVLARDVSLTLAHQHDTSILNIFPAQVVELYPESPSQMTVRLDAGGTALLARITHKSANLLGLEPGKAVHMQVKSVALLG